VDFDAGVGDDSELPLLGLRLGLGGVDSECSFKCRLKCRSFNKLRIFLCFIYFV
jgi:hypothetical protein